MICKASAKESAECASASPRVQVGQVWAARQRKHHGWLVQVLTVTAHRVRFRCDKGPGHALGQQCWMTLDIFTTCYEQRRPCS